MHFYAQFEMKVHFSCDRTGWEKFLNWTLQSQTEWKKSERKGERKDVAWENNLIKCNLIKEVGAVIWNNRLFLPTTSCKWQ